MSHDPPPTDPLTEISERLKYLESVVRDQISRLYAIEQRLGIEKRADPQRQTQQPPDRTSPTGLPPKPVEPDRLADQTVPPLSRKSTPPSGPESAPSPQGESHKERKQAEPYAYQHLNRQGPASTTTAPSRGKSGIAERREGLRLDLENRIGGSWFNRIGVLAICIGVGFFLKLAFDRQWIGPWGRVSMGVAAGLAFLAGGERLRRRYAGYAYGLSGGGVLILYLSFFAAYNTYHIIPRLVAFVLMAAITATASLLAARYNALPIAILGLIGGFLTPILLSTGVDNQIGLFGYIALLDLGVLALAYSKQWRQLNYLSFCATVLMIAGWMLSYWEPSKLWTTIFFLTLFFIIFALLAVLYNVINKQPTGWADLALVFANALFYFGTSYELLDDYYHNFLGLFAVLVSAFYLALGYFTYRRDREDRLLILTFLGLAFLFLVLAVPIQFDQHWVTMAWAIEAAVMTWIGLKVNDRTSRYAALLLLVVAVSHWALIDVQEFAIQIGEEFTPLLNRRAVSCGVLIAALATCGWLYKRLTTGSTADERSMFRGLYLLGANALAVILLSLDINDHFELASAYDSNLDALAKLNSSREASLSGLWTVYGGISLLVGIAHGLRFLRYASLVLVGIATLKVMAVDLRYYDAPWHNTLFNQTFATLLLLSVVMAASAWFYSRSTNVSASERSAMIPVLAGLANILAVIGLSAEAMGHFERAKALAGSQSLKVQILENTKQLVLTTVWTIYGASALINGIIRKQRPLRIGAVCLLALAILKTLMIDLQYYAAEWHTTFFNQTFAAFVLLIAALVVCSRIYQRHFEIEEAERVSAANAMVGVSNLLMIVALSAEARGYFKAQISTGGELTDTFRDLRLAEQLSLSLIWMVYGGAMLTIGILRRNRMLRVMALVLLGITIFKVFLLDLASLDRIYRIISFIVLGAILLTVSFLYQRHRQRAGDSL